MRANILLLIATILGVGVAMAATNEVHAQGGCGNDTQQEQSLNCNGQRIDISGCFPLTVHCS
jgi:hypothetical protein